MRDAPRKNELAKNPPIRTRIRERTPRGLLSIGLHRLLVERERPFGLIALTWPLRPLQGKNG